MQAGTEPPAAAKSAQKIGDLWARFLHLLSSQPKEAISVLKRLGVAETDEAAHRQLIPLMIEASKPDVVIEPNQEVDKSGVYFLSRPGIGRFAVFKVGEKRGDMELLARRIAHRMELPYAIPGVFCTIANPTFPKDMTVVELWNGNQKIFKGDENMAYSKLLADTNFGLKEPYTITGILEPYIPPEKGAKISPDDFAAMTAFSLAIGLRDAKLDGIGVIEPKDGQPGVVLYDNDECMPKRLLPGSSPNRHVAATHLPYLTHPLAKEPIPLKTMTDLTEKVKKFTGSLRSRLRELDETVSFPDLPSEDLVPVEDFAMVMQQLRSLERQTSKDKELFDFDDDEFAQLLALLRAQWNPKEVDFELENVLEVIEQCRANDKSIEAQELAPSQTRSQEYTREDGQRVQVDWQWEASPLKTVDKKMFPRIVKLCTAHLDDRAQDELHRLLRFCHSGWDHGGCPVFVERTKKIMESTPIVHLGKTQTLLSDEQVDAFVERVYGLQHFFTKAWKTYENPVTTLDLVGYVDPLYKEHLDALQKAGFDRIDRMACVGRFAPVASVSLSPRAVSRLKASPTHLSRARSGSPPRSPQLLTRIHSAADLEALTQKDPSDGEHKEKAPHARSASDQSGLGSLLMGGPAAFIRVPHPPSRTTSYPNDRRHPNGPQPPRQVGPVPSLQIRSGGGASAPAAPNGRARSSRKLFDFSSPPAPQLLDNGDPPA